MRLLYNAAAHATLRGRRAPCDSRVVELRRDEAHSEDIMPNRTWRFSSIPHQQGRATAHLWKWEALVAARPIGQSRRLFGTLAECVSDAQQCGFRGAVEPQTGRFVATEYHITVHDDGAVTLNPL
jgi:hypothetical protein